MLKGATLFQYASEAAAAAGRPAKAHAVCFAVRERFSDEELEAELDGAAPLEQDAALERAASSLRLVVFTPHRVKLLSAPSDAALEAWAAPLQAAVEAHTPADALGGVSTTILQLFCHSIEIMIAVVILFAVLLVKFHYMQLIFDPCIFNRFLE